MACKVAILGAGTLAGREILNTLAERSFPLTQIRLFDDNCVGQYLAYNNTDVMIEEISEHVLKESRFKVVFYACSDRSYIPFALEGGAFVIDCGFDSKLIISGINSSDIEWQNIVSNPRCLTIHLCRILHGISKKTKIKRINASTYQSVSGAGFLGIEELERQVDEIEKGREATLHYFSKQIAYNVVPQISDFEGEWTKEELNIPKEVNQILNQKIDMSFTCVRVPVLRGHSMSVMMELSDDLSVEDIYDSMEDIDIYAECDYPTPWEMEGLTDIAVARLRKDPNIKKCYHFWTVADNQAACFALNSVKIAEDYISAF